jgi:hypothetical protein
LEAAGLSAPTAAGPIDWSAPWLAPYRDVGERVERRWRGGLTVADALNVEWHSGRAARPRFVDASALSPAEAYEAFIARTGGVPTRDNAHDFFNGLVWLLEPALKTAMNALQAAEIRRAGIGARRGRLRDALTLLDENGALLQAPAPLVDALAARDWHRLFVDGRALWRDARLRLVGHALLDKLQQPRKPITAHVLVTPAALTEPTAALEHAVQCGGPVFLPLPVLGVPGWWPANEDSAFYDDASVFRPARRR